MKTIRQIKSRLEAIELVMDQELQKRKTETNYKVKMIVDTQLSYLETQKQLLYWILDKPML